MMSSLEIVLPEGQLEGSEATLSAWLVKAGDSVQQDQPLCELETDKVTMEIAAPQAGVLEQCCVAEGESVTEGVLLAWLAESLQEKEVAVTEVSVNEVKQQTAAVTSTVADNKDQRWSPAVRRILSENSIDLNKVVATGKNGRVTKQDLLSYLANQTSQPTETLEVAELPKVKPQSVAPAPVANDPAMPSKMRPHSKMRTQIASHMVESLLHTSPHVTSVFEADLSAISRHRAQHKEEFSEAGIKLSYTAYFIAAAAEALREVPEVNSRFHEDALEMFQDCNIGIGTALGDNGLVVPVIKRTQELNLRGIARNLQDLTDAAHQGTLKPSDMKNGTFTISNHGVSGSLVATPIIINQPQTAILGIGKMEKRVVVREVDGVDTMVIKPMCYITLTIDHRALDGYQTNKFLSKVVDVLEQWPSS